MKRSFILIIAALSIAICTTLWWINGNTPVSLKSSSQKIFTVTKGEGSHQIANELKADGLIRDSLVFLILSKLGNYDNKIEVGDFQLSSNMTPVKILAIFTKGTLDEWVTIPEGLRATEIAAILEKTIPTYDSSWDTKLIAQEGYLFPDTYLIPKSATVDQIISIMENNFNAKYEIAKKQQTNKLTEQQAVILASIVQHEANTPHDMQYVASVFENRLNIGMALGSDVTVEYAIGYDPVEKTWWKKNLTADDLSINSPYNTRVNAGLPPGPISNPGLDALKAVLNPPVSNYLYFIADNKGVVHFAKTLEEHNANIAKYGN